MSHNSVYVPSGREIAKVLTLVLLAGVLIGVGVSKACNGLSYRVKIERVK